jgi:hypothetical protein
MELNPMEELERDLIMCGVLKMQIEGIMQSQGFLSLEEKC